MDIQGTCRLAFRRDTARNGASINIRAQATRPVHATGPQGKLIIVRATNSIYHSHLLLLASLVLGVAMRLACAQPSSFSLISASPNCTGGTSIDLNWQDADGALVYHVYRDGIEIGTEQSTTYTDHTINAAHTV